RRRDAHGWFARASRGHYSEVDGNALWCAVGPTRAHRDRAVVRARGEASGVDADRARLLGGAKSKVPAGVGTEPTAARNGRHAGSPWQHTAAAVAQREALRERAGAALAGDESQRA